MGRVSTARSWWIAPGDISAATVINTGRRRHVCPVTVTNAVIGHRVLLLLQVSGEIPDDAVFAHAL